MRGTQWLGLAAVMVVLHGCEDDSCFSPTQNLDHAYEEGAEGCGCDPSVDEGVCIDGVALVCEAGHWLAVEDGPCEPTAPDLTCFSPTQNTESAYEPGAKGCSCNAAVDEDVCIGRVALVCEDGRWQGVEDGPCEPRGKLDASVDAGDMCEASWQTFRSFVDSHRDCEQSADCAIIGDCGPYAVFEAVRADVAKKARELQLATCGGAYDGPEFEAVCVKGTCVRRILSGPGYGCPPAPDDAGTEDAGE